MLEPQGLDHVWECHRKPGIELVFALQIWAWGAVGEHQGGTADMPVLVKGLPNDVVAAAVSGAHQHFLFILAKVKAPLVA